MQIASHHDVQADVLICTVTGALETAIVRAFFRDLFADPVIPDNIDIVWDIRTFDFSSAQPSAIRQLAADRVAVDPQRQGSRYAFVVSDPAQEIIAKLYWAHSHNIDQEKDVFRTVEDAVRWLKANRTC